MTVSGDSKRDFRWRFFSWPPEEDGLEDPALVLGLGFVPGNVLILHESETATEHRNDLDEPTRRLN